MSQLPPVPEPPRVRDVRNFREKIADIHRESVAGGYQGPLLLFGAFLSSSIVLIWRAGKWCFTKTKQQCGY
jgi:hypothetical protein